MKKYIIEIEDSAMEELKKIKVHYSLRSVSSTVEYLVDTHLRDREKIKNLEGALRQVQDAFLDFVMKNQ